MLATDWENGNEMLTRRPDWLLPVIFASLSALMGSLDHHSLRRWGVATIMGLTALVIRFGLIQAFGYSAITIQTWLPILSPLIALDIWYALRVRAARQNANPKLVVTRPVASAAGDGLAVLVGMTGSFSLIDRIFTYPPLVFPGVIGMGVASFIAATLASWIGSWFGAGLAVNHKQVEERAAQPGFIRRLAPAILFGIVVVFIVFFITTATQGRYSQMKQSQTLERWQAIWINRT